MRDAIATMVVSGLRVPRAARILAGRGRRTLERARKSALALAERELELARLDRALLAVRERQSALRREVRFEADLAHVEQVRKGLAQVADDEQTMLGARVQLAARVAAAAREFAASTRALRAMRRKLERR